MKTLIHIIIKNDPLKLNKILKSIYDNDSLRELHILIIDDSVDNNLILKNKEVIKKSLLNINHIYKNIWNEYKIKILNSISSDFIEKLHLGLDKWNTPNVRNIGQVLINMLYSNFSYIIYFDDDMDVTNLNYSPNKINSSIIGINISGSPDLSRFEWIQLYLRVLLGNKKYINSDYLDYPDELYLNFSNDYLSSYIKEYTDLSLINESGSNINDYIIPVREEFSGGAYINSIQNLGIGVFPDVYNEDWCYVNMINNINNSDNIFYQGGGVIHASSKKEILDLVRLLEEEEGEFYQLYFRLEDKTKYSEIINRKLKIIEHEILLCNTLINDVSLSELEDINKSLKIFKVFYLDLVNSIDKYKEMHEMNIFNNFHWKNIHNKLSNII